MKVGRAVNERMRMADLQIGNPRELVIRAALDQPDSVERYFHDLLAPYWVRGEWYRTDSLVSLCALACAQAGEVCPSDICGGLDKGKTGGPLLGAHPGAKEKPAARLARWLVEYAKDTGDPKIPLKVPRQRGPIRDKERFWAAINELAESGCITPADEGNKRFIVVNGVAAGEPLKQRWSRESYNAYQREYMRKRRSSGRD
jgi:hypothetical protein